MTACVCSNQIVEREEVEEFITHYQSPLGLIEITGSPRGVVSVLFVESPQQTTEVPAFLQEGLTQLHEYFNGQRQQFTLRLDLHGTAFQKRIWQELLKIPFSATVSYRDIAHGLGNPQAVRAVGHANGRNPICIIVPCHRVIGTNGSLIGYGGGLWRKQWLLQFERAQAAGQGDFFTRREAPLRSANG